MEIIWQNGELKGENATSIGIFDRGLIYGDGFFETILCQNGKPCFLAEHLHRLHFACQEFHITLPKDIDWQAAISSLLEAQALQQGQSALKIMVTRGKVKPGLSLWSQENPNIIISARRYQPPPGEKYTRGLSVVTYPIRRSCPMARYKSLNYLYYLTAREYASSQKADEAILMDPQGRVLECAAGNIFIRRGEEIFTTPPQAPYLKGIIEKQVICLLKKGGYRIRRKYTYAKSLTEAHEIFISNSLIRVMPVGILNGFPMKEDFACSEFLLQMLAENMNG